MLLTCEAFSRVCLVVAGVKTYGFCTINTHVQHLFSVANILFTPLPQSLVPYGEKHFRSKRSSHLLIVKYHHTLSDTGVDFEPDYEWKFFLFE